LTALEGQLAAGGFVKGFSRRNWMLVLSRKVGEEIMIGDEIRLVVNRVSGNRVTIGIKAPSDVHIVRGELTHFTRPAEDAPPRDRLSAAI
jgi:carbon storage regulator